MKLKCRIHEKDYDIVAGATFSEEYNETLDSGSIIIDQIPKIKGLKPYDDVYIWKADEEFNGYVNVGDKILVESLGGSASYSYYPAVSFDHTQLTVTDFETENNIIFSGELITFKSHRIIADSTNIQGSNASSTYGQTFPSIVDLWLSCFLHNMDVSSVSGRQSRWGFTSDGFTIKVSLHNVLSFSSITGYYKFPNHKRDNVIPSPYSGEEFLKLTKVSSYPNSNNAPDVLYIRYSAKICIINYAIAPSVGTVANLNISAKGSSDLPATETNTYTILSVEPPTSNHFSYYYFKVASGLNEIREGLTLSFNGLTEEEIVSIKSLQIRFIARGYLFSGICSRPAVINDGNTILLSFKFLGSYFYNSDGVNLRLTKTGEKQWSLETANGFDVIFQQYHYPADGIIGDIFENMYVYVTRYLSERLPSFFKHFLIDSFSCDMLQLETTENKAKRLYKYKIDLFSEIKKLEKIILPNISITQPIVGQKRSIWYYLNQFVDMYSTKYKSKLGTDGWEYKNKYKIDAREPGDYGTIDAYTIIPLHEIFTDDIYAPEMSLTAPTLREVLTRLMVVKDCIPIVRNDVIYAMEIGKTRGNFAIHDDNFSYISENMNSANYATSFRREYGGAISQNNTAHLVDFLGFRANSNSDGLMTLSNMVLQTRFPIYKINKLYLCYYKAITVTNNQTGTTSNRLVLVKQDMTKLVLQNTVRNALAAEWGVGSTPDWRNFTLDDMSRYKIFTVGYDIGSNTISGWGDTFNYIWGYFSWDRKDYTYLEIIMKRFDYMSPFGISGYQFLKENETVTGGTSWEDTMVSENNDINNITNKLKSVFFQVDYTAMYSGAVIHSKENTDDDDIQTPDNCSSALSILEVDGLFEREKANRLANPEVNMIARFDSVAQMDSSSFNNIIGAEYVNDDGESAVIYHREYQIYDDCILANFVGTHDYVLKNYFTTVFAKYRTYSYASYEENVNRAEVDKYLVFLSDNNCYFEEDDNGLKQQIVTSVLSAFSETIIGDDLLPKFEEQINGGYFTFFDGDNANSYFSDVNQFVSGYSLCFNIKMYDNVTSGSYIERMNCYSDGTAYPHTGENYVGTQLEWHKMPISDTDGFLRTVGCYFGHFNEDDYYKSEVDDWYGSLTQIDILYRPLYNLPLKSIQETFTIGKNYEFCKDNKETIDFTLQYELVNQDDNLIFSEWLMKLTDFNSYVKLSGPTAVYNASLTGNSFTTKYWCEKGEYNQVLANWGGDGYLYKQCIKMIFASASDLANNTTVSAPLSPAYSTSRIVWGAGPGELAGIYPIFMKCKPAFIQEVISSNGEITGLKVRVDFQTNDVKNTRQNNPDYVESMSSVVVTFERVPSTLEFQYNGYLVPTEYTAIESFAKRNLKNNSHLSEANAKVEDCKVYSPGSDYSFPKTMYVLLSDQELKQDLIYEQLYLNDLPSGYEVANVSQNGSNDGNTFEDLFSIQTDEYGRPYIIFHVVPSINLDYGSADVKSIQYWYYDVEGDGYLHFVFGINKYDENGSAIYDRKIYISTMKNRNPTVYDAQHRETGHIMNFAEDGNASKYGEQLFVPNEEDD